MVQKPNFNFAIGRLRICTYYPYAKFLENNDIIGITVNQTDNWFSMLYLSRYPNRFLNQLNAREQNNQLQYYNQTSTHMLNIYCDYQSPCKENSWLPELHLQKPPMKIRHNYCKDILYRSLIREFEPLRLHNIDVENLNIANINLTNTRFLLILMRNNSRPHLPSRP